MTNTLALPAPAPPPAPARLRARRMDPTQRRNVLLDAAIDVVHGQGLRALTLQAVAARAGVSLPLVSLRLGTRDQLCKLIVGEAVLRHDWELVGEAVALGDPAVDNFPAEFLEFAQTQYIVALLRRPPRRR